jgi:hypothetical protein
MHEPNALPVVLTRIHWHGVRSALGFGFSKVPTDLDLDRTVFF